MIENVLCYCGRPITQPAAGGRRRRYCGDLCSRWAKHNSDLVVLLVELTGTPPRNESGHGRRSTQSTPETQRGGVPVKVTDGSDAFLQLLYRVNNNRLRG